MRKWNFGDVFVKGHTERLWQKWNLYSGLQESKVHTQSSTPHCPHENIKEWIARGVGEEQGYHLIDLIFQNIDVQGV